MPIVYGSTLRREHVQGHIFHDLWIRTRKTVIGSAIHGLPLALAAAISAQRAPLRPRDWVRLLSRAPGVRKDARSWYNLDGWLDGQPDRALPAQRLLDRLSERDVVLHAGWSPEHDDTLLITLPTNPASDAVFSSVHHDGVPNVLMHLVLAPCSRDGQRWLELREVQSDWHQQAARFGRLSWKDETALSDCDQADPVPPAPFETSWPRLGLCIALATAKAHEYAGVTLAEGDRVAARCGADEPIRSVRWCRDGTALHIETLTGIDGADPRTRRLPTIEYNAVNCLRHGAHGLPSSIGRAIIRRLGSGSACGVLGEDWFDRQERRSGMPLRLRNIGLRRFYDSHLVRELGEIGRLHDCVTEGVQASVAVSTCPRLLAIAGSLPRNPALLAWRIPDSQSRSSPSQMKAATAANSRRGVPHGASASQTAPCPRIVSPG